MNRIIIGIDISKRKFDAAYLVVNQKWRQGTFDNSLEGFKNFIKWLEEKKVENCHVVMEATGRYGEDLANFLYISGHTISIVNPVQIKYYGCSLLKRTKTDQIDSQLIAEFAQRHDLPSWQPLSPSLQSLKDQVRCLDAFKNDATQTSNRLGHAKDLVVKQMLKDRLAYIEKQIKELTLKIKKLVHDDPVLTRNVNLLTSIPGIGETSAFSLLTEVPDLSTFKCAKQLAAFAGLNPSIKTSGNSVKGKEQISKTGNKMLRKILYLPAMSTMSRSSPIKPFIERLRGKGKKGKSIIVAVMRKLIHIVFGVLKTQTTFQGAL